MPFKIICCRWIERCGHEVVKENIIITPLKIFLSIRVVINASLCSWQQRRLAANHKTRNSILSWLTDVTVPSFADKFRCIIRDICHRIKKSIPFTFYKHYLFIGFMFNKGCVTKKVQRYLERYKYKANIINI